MFSPHILGVGLAVFKMKIDHSKSLVNSFSQENYFVD